MQRRLALASTLIHKPELLFLDEPTAGIDPILRRKIWDYFEALRAEGIPLFVTTQYVGEAAYCDLVGVMARGTACCWSIRQKGCAGGLLVATWSSCGRSANFPYQPDR